MKTIKNGFFKNRLKISLMALGIAIPPIISTTVFATVIKVDNKQYWLFDNQTFDNLQSIHDYIEQNTQVTSFSANAKSYLVNKNLFNSKMEMNNYLKTKFPIRDDVYTYHDPQNYVINSAGELSKQVLWNEDSSFTTVYKGKDGVAYKTRKQALDTYKKYKKVYTIDGQGDVESFYDAYNYLLQVKMHELQKNPKQLMYPNGGLYQSEIAIKNWLRKNIKRGFKYREREFSDFNYDQFLTFFNGISEDDQIFTENIKSIADANLNSYWVNLDQISQGETGTFSGPKYIETASDLKKIEPGDWQEIDSYTPGLIMGITGSTMIASTVTTKYQSRNSNDDFKWKYDDLPNGKIDDYTKIGFYNFLIHLQKDLNIISPELVSEIKKTLLKNVNFDNTDDLDNFETRSIMSATVDLDSLASNSSEFTNIHKLMVAIKRILNYMKIFASFSEQDIAQAEMVLQKLVYEIITFNLKDSNDTSEQLDDDVFGLKENLKTLSVQQLISLILDPNDFYQSGAQIQEIKNIMQKGDQVINTISNIVGTANWGLNKVKDKVEGQQKKKEYDELKNDVKDLQNNVEKIFEQKASDILKSMGLKNLKVNKKTDSFASLLSLTPPLKIASFLFNLEKTLSFVTFKTYEYKIDNRQSIYYYIQVPKIPFLNIESSINLPTIPVQTISESTTSKMIPKGNEELSGTPSEIYEFEGKYYLNKNNAIKALKAAIYLNPEWFIPTHEILTSNIEFDGNYILSQELKISKNPKKGGLSSTQYNELLKEEINNYVQILFDDHYKAKGLEVITDGFGNIMENSIQAQEVLREKLKDGSEIESRARYYYETSNVVNPKVYGQTVEELDNKINQTQIIQEKEVISDDLIRTAIFDDLEEFTNKYYNIYELTFYGNKKYFATYKQAWTYLTNHLASNYREIDYRFNDETYKYKDVVFKSKVEYDNWIKQQIKEIDYNEFLDRRDY